ncbi:restriction endonuclease [Saccharopolyspora taberi]|uniref:Restriction endonuclease n=1 Tax=Saccharopolyspora taberi TaxID=60895 RepID=A0ABN3V0U7_9PSEU
MAQQIPSWADRSNTIGFVPGKKSERREILRRILEQLPAAPGSSIAVRNAAGEDVTSPVDDICGNQLSCGMLVRREPDGRWVATDAAKSWLENQDDVAFAVYIHDNVKLFGELLSRIERARSKDGFLAIAHEFGLTWTSTDQLYRRVAWLEVLGLVERWAPNKFVVTERGREFLARAALVSPEEATGTTTSAADETETLPEPGDIVLNLTSKNSYSRKDIIGYIPRGRKAPDRDSTSGPQSPFDAIRNLLDLVGDGVGVEEYHRRCFSRLGLKKASATQTIQTMRQMGVMDMVAYGQYGPLPDVAELLNLGSEVDFVRYLHSRYSFVGEILTLLDEPTPVPEVARIANEEFGLARIDNGEVRTRMGFLADAGLVERIDWTRYRISATGKLLADELRLDLPTGEVAADESVEPAESTTDAAQADQIIADLRRYGRNGERSEEFEIAVAAAFGFLGFRSQHTGGSGRTDVVVDAELPAKDSYRVIVDAKASSSGTIAENAVKFDALKDHQKRHRADFGMVVGPDFGGRVREWAANNNFSLMTVEDLANLLTRHAVHPISLTDLRVLFQTDGDDLADVEELYAESARSAELLARIVALLHEEAREEDPLLDGYISLENVNYALRKELSPRPSQNAVEECLQLLSHDLVRGAVKNGGRYKLADAPVNIMRRLAGLGVGLDGR